MTIDDVMLRDILDAERDRKRAAEMAEYDRKIARRMRRRRFKALGMAALQVAATIAAARKTGASTARSGRNSPTATSIAREFKKTLDHTLNCILFAKEKGGAV